MYSLFLKKPKSVKWQSQIFYILQPYLFFYIYDHLSIPCFVDMFIFAKAYEA